MFIRHHNPERRATVKALKKEGLEASEIAKRLGLKEPLVYYYLRTPDIQPKPHKIPVENYPLIKQRAAKGEKGKDLAREYGVCQATISRILRHT